MLLQTSNRKWYTVLPFEYGQFWWPWVTFRDRHVLHTFYSVILHTIVCNNWQDFNWHSALHSPSAIGEHLVVVILTHHCSYCKCVCVHRLILFFLQWGCCFHSLIVIERLMVLRRLVWLFFVKVCAIHLRSCTCADTVIIFFYFSWLRKVVICCQ